MLEMAAIVCFVLFFALRGEEWRVVGGGGGLGTLKI